MSWPDREVGIDFFWMGVGVTQFWSMGENESFLLFYKNNTATTTKLQANNDLPTPTLDIPDP